MAVPIEVKSAGELKIFVKYSDGIQGEISLQHLKDDPEYNKLNDAEFFNGMFIDDKTKDICWSNGISLCKNAIYKQLELKNLMKNLRLDLDTI